MSWYTKFIMAAGGFTSVIRPDVRGRNFCYVSGPTWEIAKDLGSAGFAYDRNARTWSRDAASFAKDTAAQQTLRQLGVPIPSMPVSRQQPQQSPPSPAQQPPVNTQTAKNWLLAKSVNLPPLPPGTPVVMTKTPDGNWQWQGRDGQGGTLQNGSVKQAVESVRDAMGQLIQSTNPQELFEAFDAMNTPEQSAAQPAATAEPTPEQAQRRKKGVISPENITAEQQAITADFGKGQNITTGALAGTGKTTAIFHLACTYGKDGEDWQYLVFNTKNKVEAKLKSKKYGIDGFFKADSTNGYLGQVIESRDNAGKIPKTTRMVSIEKNPKKKIPDKIGLMLDGPDVTNAMKRYGMVNPEMLQPSSLSPRMQGDRIMFTTVKSIVANIRKEFKRSSKALCSLGKAYAVDPRKGQQHVRTELLRIADNHDVDFELTKIKERIGDYPDSFRAKVLPELQRILGYDIMSKNLRQEILETAEFLLSSAMPKASNQKYVHTFKDGKQQSFTLGDMRDFDDDLWYAAINADKLRWPKKKVVLADEAQDFNKCQIIALQHLAKAGAQVMIVGDKNQAMYRFRGALDGAIEEMAKMLGTQKLHSLSLNFRQRPALIDFSNEHSVVKDLKRGLRLSDKDIQEAFADLAKPSPQTGQAEYFAEIRQKYPGSTNGIDVKKWRQACNSGQEKWPPSAQGVVTFKQHDYKSAINAIKNQKDQTGKVKATAILSPTNAELVPAALDLLGHGIPFVITGSDLAKQLVDHTKDMMSDKRGNINTNAPAREFLDKLLNHRDEQVRRHGHKASKEGEIQELERVTHALETCVHMFDPNLNDAAHNPMGDVDPNSADEMEAWRAANPGQVAPAPRPNSTVAEFMRWLNVKLKGKDIETNEADAEEYMKMMENEDDAPVTLSTVHRAKGLEFPDVYILNYDGLLNPPNVTRPEDLQQWRHAHYVALTRAKDSQHIIKGDDDD
jgi:superfamily I DNA/RNA helicase